MCTQKMSRKAMVAAVLNAESIERIEIEIVDGRRFVWRLFSEGKEVMAVDGDHAEVAAMLQASEVIINTELGVEGATLCQPALN